MLEAVVAGLALIYLLRWRGLVAARRKVALSILAVVTLAVGASAIFLVVSPSVAGVSAFELLRDAVLLWASNIVNFALWYWEVDGGGPVHRLMHRTTAAD